MLAGKLRILGANDPDPYPDAIKLDVSTGAASGAEAVTVEPYRKRKKLTPLQKLTQKQRAAKR